MHKVYGSISEHVHLAWQLHIWERFAQSRLVYSRDLGTSLAEISTTQHMTHRRSLPSRPSRPRRWQQCRTNYNIRGLPLQRGLLANGLHHKDIKIIRRDRFLAPYEALTLPQLITPSQNHKTHTNKSANHSSTLNIPR